MSHQRSWIAAATAALVFSVAIPTFAAPPTLDDARAAFAANEYRQCLQKISGALSGPQGKAGSPERYDLLMLRGEAMLRLGERRLASEAFKSASTVAKSKEDRQRMADAMGTGLLIAAAKGNAYTPTTGAAGGPIDILDRESRKKAMEAFYNDSLAASQSRIESAASGQSVEVIREMIPKVRDLYAIELAATGEGAKTLPLARSLGKRARDLIGGGV